MLASREPKMAAYGEDLHASTVTLIIGDNNEAPESNIELLAIGILELDLLGVGRGDVYLIVAARRVMSQGLGPEDFEDLAVPVSDVLYASTSASEFREPSPAVAASREGNSPRPVGTFVTIQLYILLHFVSLRRNQQRAIPRGLGIY